MTCLHVRYNSSKTTVTVVIDEMDEIDEIDENKCLKLVNGDGRYGIG